MADPLHWLYEHIEAQDNPTTLGRLRAVADEIERLRAEVERRALPPGHHHVTVADDGGWHAEPMERVGTPGGVYFVPDEGLWVDAPVQGDDRG